MKIKQILCLLAVVPSLHALSIEGDIGYFRPTSSLMREVYSEAWINFGVNASQKIVDRLNVFGALNLMPNWGSSLAGSESTSIFIFPITLGLEWAQPVHESVELYIGAAPRYYLTWIHDDSSSVPHHQFLNGFGGYVMAGAKFYPRKHFLIDLDVGYGFRAFGKTQTSPTGAYESYGVNVGGLDVSLGLGYRF